MLNLDYTNNTIDLLFHKKACIDKLIEIPFNIIITDAFQNKVLTPLSELSYITKEDYISLIAWQITNTWLNHKVIQAKLASMDSVYRIAFQYKPIAFKIVLTLVMSAISYNQISGLSVSFVNNAITEIIDKADRKQKNENASEVDFIFAESLHEIVFNVLNDFWQQYIDQMKTQSLAMLINNLMCKYEAIAKECTETIATGAKSNIVYSPNRFKYLDNFPKIPLP